MKIGFSTLGCPAWDFNKILNTASSLGYDGIEFRGILGEFELYRNKNFSQKNLQSTRRRMEDLSLEPVCLSSSASFHWQDRDELQKNIDEAKKFIDLAYETGSQFVRVFPNNIPPGEEKSRTMERISDSLVKVGEHADNTSVKVVLETHGDFLAGEDIAKLISATNNKNVGVLWDVHHPYRFLNEDPQKTARYLAENTWHSHFKDSTGEAGDFTYTLLGEGDVPLQKFIELLRDSGYNGYLCLEWEKAWIPELQEPEEVFPQYIYKVKNYLEELNNG